MGRQADPATKPCRYRRYRAQGALPHAGPELALPLRKQIEESGRGAQDPTTTFQHPKF